MGTTSLFVVIAYVIVMLIVGWWSMKRTKSVSDFFLGGRSLGPWMSAFAYGTTYFSAVMFIGYAGKLGWGFGIHTMWIVVGNAFIGTFLAWGILGARTRVMTARLNAMTMPEFLANRYQSKFLKIAAALIVFIFLVPYSASVYSGLSYLLEKCSHIPYIWAVSIMAVLTGVYIMMGGYFALAITDLIRGIVEIIGVSIMVIFLASKVGGFSVATHKLMAPACSPALHAPGPLPGWVMLLSLVVLTSFGPWGLPQMVQKFYSIKSEAYIKSTMIVCTIFGLLMAFGAYYSGALTHLFYHGKLPVQNIDELMPTLLTQKVPDWLSMVILLLVFSASMSSLSSLVLVSSSAIAMDLYAGVLKPNADKRTVMILMRVLCGVFVAASLALAMRQLTFIVNLMALSWGALAGSFAAPYVYGLFWRRATRAGATAGLLSGLIIAAGLVLAQPQIYMKYSPVFGALGIVVPFAVVPIVSLFTKQLPKEIVNKAFSDEAGQGV